MGRKPKARTVQAVSPSVDKPIPMDILAQTLALARWQRLVLTACFAIGATLLVTPVIDNLYVAYFFHMDTRMIPTFISTGLGVLVYGLGHWLLIGHVGEAPPPRRAALWYLLAGCFVLAFALVLVVIGVYTNVLRG